MGIDNGVSYDLLKHFGGLFIHTYYRQLNTHCISNTDKYFRRFSRNQGDRGIWNTMGRIAQQSNDKHLYAFITSRKGAVMGGWANIAALCAQRTRRVSISRIQYNAIVTARVIIYFVKK